MMAAFLGGALIGIASALLLVLLGRIAGVSGIVGALFERPADRAWRIAFVSGLLGSGVLAMVVAPGAIEAPPHSLPIVIAAGVLVGFGTRLGGGCTSGHGVCGLGRLSARSLVAVIVFMTTGALAAWVSGGDS